MCENIVDGDGIMCVYYIPYVDKFYLYIYIYIKVYVCMGCIGAAVYDKCISIWLVLSFLFITTWNKMKQCKLD